MPFQGTVFLQQGFGVPGQLFTDAPYIVQPYTLVSAQSAYNIIGATAFTITSQGVAQAGSAGTLGFAGILVNPKNAPLYGANGLPLSPSFILPNNFNGALATMGSFVVTLGNTANIGDVVYYDNTTGALGSVAPGTSIPTGKTFANAIVDQFAVTTAGLAVIKISNNFPAL